MGLLDDISSEQRLIHPRRCSVVVILESMDESDAADLTSAMADPGISHVAIVRALDKRGFHLDDQALSRHRRNVCACAR